MLSVVIPTYQRVDSLARLIRGLCDQTVKDLELIVVDQNEPGFLRNTLPPEILRAASFIHLPEPNASKARNRGFAESTRPYVLFIDDDLEPEPNFCGQALATLQQQPRVKCLCPVVYSDLARVKFLPVLEQVGTGITIEGTHLSQITQTITAAVFIERNYFQQSGGFDELLFSYARTAEDQEFFLRMGRRGLEIWLDESLSIVHDESVPGGCNLRTDPYWQTRERCVRSWVFRYRTHASCEGRLRYRDMWRLARSSFLNRGTFKSGAGQIVREARLLLRSVTDSRRFLQPHLSRYRSIGEINYLTQYKSS